MILTISGGEYSYYWEHWYQSDDEGVTHADLAQRLLEHVEEADQWYESLKENENRFGAYETHLMMLCGFTRIQPDLEVDTGGFSFPRGKADIEELADKLMKGDTQP